MKNQLVIIRGIPGSGKSTYVKKHFPSSAVVCSADHFFEKDGEYVFNGKLIWLAHKYCNNKFLAALKEKKPLIVLDNTNVKIKDMKPYVAAAKEAGYSVRIIRLVVDPKIAHARNIHNVSAGVVSKMQAKFQVAPKEWHEKIITETKGHKQ